MAQKNKFNVNFNVIQVHRFMLDVLSLKLIWECEADILPRNYQWLRRGVDLLGDESFKCMELLDDDFDGREHTLSGVPFSFGAPLRPDAFDVQCQNQTGWNNLFPEN